jgi:hypothetical protein
MPKVAAGATSFGISNKSLYFHAGGKLRDQIPSDSIAENGHDEFPSDPSKPVPFIDKIGIGML